MDAYVTVDSALAPLFVGVGPAGVAFIDVAGEPAGFEVAYQVRTGRSVAPVDALPGDLQALLEEAVALGRPGELPLDLAGLTDFQRAVLAATAEIPLGEVRPYGWVAAEIGRPRAVRAVGSALGANPVPLVVPCHRVVRTGGSLGHYGLGGTEAKRRLLDHELALVHARG